MWVAPFGNPRLSGYLLLPAAYRSLSRPSSAPDAKAFPLRPFQLDLVVAGSISLALPLAAKLTHSADPPLPTKPASLGFRSAGNGKSISLSQRSCQRNFGSLKNYAGFTDSRNCNCYPASLRMLFHNYCFSPYGFPLRLPLCCLTSLALHCSVFKVRLQPFKVRNKLLIP